MHIKFKCMRFNKVWNSKWDGNISLYNKYVRTSSLQARSDEMVLHITGVSTGIQITVFFLVDNHDVSTSIVWGVTEVDSCSHHLERLQEVSQAYLAMSEDELVGTIIGEKFRVGDRIGGGSFGEIYRCTDLSDSKEVRNASSIGGFHYNRFHTLNHSRASILMSIVLNNNEIILKSSLSNWFAIILFVYEIQNYLFMCSFYWWQYAAKFERRSHPSPQLRHEYKVYRELRETRGICTVSLSQISHWRACVTIYLLISTNSYQSYTFQMSLIGAFLWRSFIIVQSIGDTAHGTELGRFIREMREEIFFKNRWNMELNAIYERYSSDWCGTAYGKSWHTFFGLSVNRQRINTNRRVILENIIRSVISKRREW